MFSRKTQKQLNKIYIERLWTNKKITIYFRGHNADTIDLISIKLDQSSTKTAAVKHIDLTSFDIFLSFYISVHLGRFLRNVGKSVIFGKSEIMTLLPGHS